MPQQIVRTPPVKTRWHFVLPLLPPSVNHAYLPNGKGGRYMTTEARSARSTFTLAALAAGFRSNVAATYRVELSFTMPDWALDLDGPVKLALDAMFAEGHHDHRIIRLLVRKAVAPGVSRTEVWIEQE